MKRVAASAGLPSRIGSHLTGCNTNLARDTTAGQESLVCEDGGVDDSDVPQLAELLWFDDTFIGEFKYFWLGLQRNGATPADFERDVQNFENNWALLNSHRALPCRFDFFLCLIVSATVLFNTMLLSLLSIV